MKVGYYVRTKAGLIAKYIGIDKKSEWHLFDNKIKWSYEYYTKEIDFEDWKEFIEEDVVKSSPNIIDLIEVGDYVNGMEVTRIGGTRWNENDLHCYCEHNGNENWKQVMIPAKDIKSILTKEQFKNMEYKVGD